MYTRECQSRVQGLKIVACSAVDQAVSSSSKASHPYPYFFPPLQSVQKHPLSHCSLLLQHFSKPKLKSYPHTESCASSPIPDLEVCYQPRDPHLISAQPSFQCQDLLPGLGSSHLAMVLTSGVSGRNNHFSQLHYSEKAPEHHIIYTTLE